jgi:hypothetical protein
VSQNSFLTSATQKSPYFLFTPLLTFILIIAAVFIFKPANAATLSIVPHAQYPSFGTGGTDIALADMNGNGYLDAIVANPAGPSGVWFYEPCSGYTYGGTDWEFLSAQSVEVANVDDSPGNPNDRPDIVAVVLEGPDAFRAKVYHNDGDKLVAGEAFGRVSNAASSSRVGIALGDINGDGHIDALLPNQWAAAPIPTRMMYLLMMVPVCLRRTPRFSIRMTLVRLNWLISTATTIWMPWLFPTAPASSFI